MKSFWIPIIRSEIPTRIALGFPQNFCLGFLQKFHPRSLSKLIQDCSRSSFWDTKGSSLRDSSSNLFRICSELPGVLSRITPVTPYGIPSEIPSWNSLEIPSEIPPEDSYEIILEVLSGILSRVFFMISPEPFGMSSDFYLGRNYWKNLWNRSCRYSLQNCWRYSLRSCWRNFIRNSRASLGVLP